MDENVNTMEKRLNATIRRLREDVQTARQEQFETDYRIMGGVEAKGLFGDPRDALIIAGRNQVLAAIRRAWEERTGQE